MPNVTQFLSYCNIFSTISYSSFRVFLILGLGAVGVVLEKPQVLVQAKAAQPGATLEVALEVKGKDVEVISISEAPSITSEEAFETDIEEREEDEVRHGLLTMIQNRTIYM